MSTISDRDPYPSIASFIPERVVYRSMAAGDGFAQRCISRHTAAFLCSGEAEYTFGKDEESAADFRGGELLWMPAGTWRKAVFRAAESRFISVQFGENPGHWVPKPLYQSLFGAPMVVHPPNQGYVEGLFRRIHRLRGQRSTSASIEVQGTLLQVIAVVAQAMEKRSVPPHLLHKVHDIEEFLLNHFDDPTLSVSDLAKRANWSTKHFIASFKQVTGQTPLAYLQRVRINHALDLLSQDDLSIHDVAHMVGYRDAAYFSRVFRKCVGVPPSQCNTQRLDDRSPGETRSS